jgi:hypothetical protein
MVILASDAFRRALLAAVGPAADPPMIKTSKFSAMTASPSVMSFFAEFTPSQKRRSFAPLRMTAGEGLRVT